MTNNFIRIEDAKYLRRKVLESSKASLSILKSYQHLLKVRGEKETLMRSLRKEMKELTILVNKLEEMMPTLSDEELKMLLPEKELPPVSSAKKGGKKKRGGTRSRKPALPPLPNEKKVYLGMPGDSRAAPEQKEIAKAEPAQEDPEPQGRLTELDALQQKMQEIEKKLGKI